MKLLAKAVFGETVLLGEDIIVGSAHDAGDRRILREPFALHQQFQRAVAAPAGRYLIPAGFLAVGTQQRPDVEALEQPAPAAVVGPPVDRHAGLNTPAETHSVWCGKGVSVSVCIGGPRNNKKKTKK